MNNPRMLRAVTVALLLYTVSPAEAGFMASYDRSDFAGSDYINWNKLGPTFTPVASPFGITTAAGISATVGDANQMFERRDQENGWGGNFSKGDPLLWNQATGAVTIDFGKFGISGGGAQIQANNYGDFVARIEALDEVGNVLASFTKSGVSDFLGNGSAIFIGVRSDTANIHKLRFSLDSANAFPEDFAINRVSVDTGKVPPHDTPEPASLALAALGGGCLLLVRRRRKNAAQGH